MMRLLATALALSVVFSGVEEACAAAHEFPERPWSEAKVVSDPCGDARVVDAYGATIFTVVSEPKERMDGVTVALTACALRIDPTEAFKAGAKRIVVRSASFEDDSFPADEVALRVRMAGPRGSFAETGLQMWRTDANGRRVPHLLRGRECAFVASARPRIYTKMVECEKGTGGYQLRIDLRGPGPFVLFSGRIASGRDVIDEEQVRGALPPPKLLFKATFDDGPEATVATGDAMPRVARNLSYEPGVKGRAVRLSSTAQGALAYAFKDNVDPRRGTVSMWVKFGNATRRARRWLFASPLDFDRRLGTGALYLWQSDSFVRGDASDDGDQFVTRDIRADNEWHHLAFSWDDTGSSIMVDGRGSGGLATTFRPVAAALNRVWNEVVKTDFGANGAFDSFSLGGKDGKEAFDGLIDEVEIWSGPLDGCRVRKELYRTMNPSSPDRPDYAALAAVENPHEGGMARQAGVPENLELAAEWRADDIAVADKFSSVGTWRRGMLAGVPFIEAGSNKYDRVAFGFAVDPAVPLHVIEIDYPDDGFRTIDYIVQDAKKPKNDYTLQVGVATGRDYPCTGRIQTHRCLYWTRAAELALIAMTCNNGAPAALSAVRIYRVRDGRLPVARMNEPPPVDGWRRTIGQYWEDPAMEYDFSVANPASPTGVVQMAQRIAALMKFTGENLFAYPGVWYYGLIRPESEEGFDPRGHAPDFLTAFYEVFDREGLSLVPLMNQHMREAPGWDRLSYGKLRSGAVHGTQLSVMDNGRVEKASFRGPTVWNIAHPEMRSYISRQVDALLSQGVRHPSFKGIGVHVKHPGLEWFGGLKSGYNDYCIATFEKATGVKVPVDRADPLRGRAYAVWLRENAYEKWVSWRCAVVTGFWVEQARKLAAARPDLKLWVNNMADIDPDMNGFRDVDHVTRMMREGGFDAVRLAREAPNLILGQTLFPAESRFFDPQKYYPTAEDRAHQRVMHLAPGFWDFMREASYPLAHQHDRYFECPQGNPKLSQDPARVFHCPWLVEHWWRVSTINPSGRSALEWFVTPLRHQDVLGLTKGGFLVGTYGMEDVLVPFAQAFRALPAVVMAETGRVGNVVARQIDFDGRSYFYVVNTGASEEILTVRFPAQTKDLVTGGVPRSNEMMKICLKPYELRSYAAPQGSLELCQ